MTPSVKASEVIRIGRSRSWQASTAADMRSMPCSSSRSEEHTSELQSHRDLHSFPTRRSSDLDDAQREGKRGHQDRPQPQLAGLDRGRYAVHALLLQQIGRAHVRTPVTPRSPLFPYATLFRSG